MKKKRKGSDAGSDEEEEEARASSICSVAFRLSDKSALQRTHAVYVLLFVSPDFLTVFTALFIFPFFNPFRKIHVCLCSWPIYLVDGKRKRRKEEKEKKKKKIKRRKKVFFKVSFALLNFFYLTGSNPVFLFFFCSLFSNL
jgi:hypothetical protein